MQPESVPPELFAYLALAFGVLMILVALQFVFVVYRDACYRNVSGLPPVYWAIGVAFFPIPFHPIYAHFSLQAGRRDRPLTSRDAWRTWLYGTVMSAAVVGWMIAPPDPITSTLTQLALLLPAGAVLYLLVFAGGFDAIVRRVGAP